MGKATVLTSLHEAMQPTPCRHRVSSTSPELCFRLSHPTSSNQMHHCRASYRICGSRYVLCMVASINPYTSRKKPTPIDQTFQPDCCFGRCQYTHCINQAHLPDTVTIDGTVGLPSYLLPYHQGSGVLLYRPCANSSLHSTNSRSDTTLSSS